MNSQNTSHLTLHGTYPSNVAAYCKHHQCHLTVKQIREHECLSQNCWHMDRLEHPWWAYRENIKRIKKEKKKLRGFQSVNTIFLCTDSQTNIVRRDFLKPLRKDSEIEWLQFEKCHDGTGVLNCKSLLDGCDSSQFRFMHCDDIRAGVSIGEHEHKTSEEIYYLMSGKGILTYDGMKYEMNPGDVSLCNIGHSHAFLATENSILIVIG